MPSAPPDPREMDNIGGARELVGYRVFVGDPDDPVKVVLNVEDKHANRNGMLHGGIISMMLDVACGFAASKHFGQGEARTPLVTLTLNTSFVSGVSIGRRVTALGHLTGGGRKIAYASGVLQDEDGTVLASAQGAFRAIRMETNA